MPTQTEAPDRPLIAIRGLKKTYLSGEVRTQVLRGVDLDVATGSFAVLMGPSGCGKTTLLNLLAALDVPDDGQITVDGIALSRTQQADLLRYRRRTIGIIFQFYNLLPTLTAQENVEVVLEPLGLGVRQRRIRAEEMLARVGLERLRHKFPGQLSGGEQQRVAIARALSKHPRLIVADEPTGSLDRANSQQVLDLMRQLNREQEVTFFVVTHDPEIARNASLLLRMEDGVMLDGASAPPAEGGRR